MMVKLSDGSYIEAGIEGSVISGMVVDDTEDFVIPSTAAPPVPPELPIIPILIAVGGVIVAIGIFFAVKR